MCDINFGDIDGACEVWKERHRKARKEHGCSSCGATISPGTSYLVVSMVFDGTASTVKACGACEADWEAFRAEHATYYSPDQLDLMLDECIDWEGAENAAHWVAARERLAARHAKAAL